MKILAPAGSAREAAALIEAGAGEIYCGLHPKSLENGFGGNVWLNRRGPGAANLTGEDELKKLVQTAHQRRVPVFLTLNQSFYPPELYPQILSLVKKAGGDCGVDAFIIGDPGLMMAVRDARPGTAVHVSSLAAVLNSGSASFFRALGASRIIFPRYMDPDDIRKVVEKTGRDVEYEVFILNDGCVFEEGHCHISHAFGGAFCHEPWNYRLIEAGGKECFRAGEDFNRHLADYREWLWYVRNCGGKGGPGGQPLGMCGLCLLPEFKKMGVSSLKIVGREASTAKKLSSVRLVRKALDICAGAGWRDVFRDVLIRLRGVPGLCSSGYMCYYR